MSKTKYFFTIEKEEQPIEVNNLNDRISGIERMGRKHKVFSVKVEADEFIELMEHLWNISQRRINKNKGEN